jgi:hypothetical protein
MSCVAPSYIGVHKHARHVRGLCLALILSSSAAAASSSSSSGICSSFCSMLRSELELLRLRKWLRIICKMHVQCAAGNTS